MTVQRTYSLPNCTLLVEGISLGESNMLSLLTNFECRFHPSQECIAGGRNLLDALVKSVGSYVQSIQRGDVLPASTNAVRLEPEGLYVHRLHVQPTEEDSPNPQPLEIQLSTVQLFDLAEGIDQLCSDRQTLPDLTLALEPAGNVKKSQVKARIVPAVMGITGFAIAATAIFFVPVPPPKPDLKPQAQVSKPLPAEPKPKPKPTPLPAVITDKELIASLQEGLYKKIDRAWKATPKFKEDLLYRVAVNTEGEIVGYKLTNSSAKVDEDNLPLKKLRVMRTDPATGGSPDTPQPTAEFLVTFTPKGKLTVEPVGKVAPESDKPVTKSSSVPTPSADLAETTLQLQDALKKKIDKAWKATPKFKEDLVYRVSVDAAGDIVSYKLANISEKVDEDRLPLKRLAIPSNSPAPQSTTDFFVTFSPSGKLDVETGKELAATLEKKLTQKIDRAWKAAPKFKEDLVYRVSINAAGEIVNYELTNSSVKVDEERLPLKKLRVEVPGQIKSSSAATPQFAADYTVTFSPNGKLSVKPGQ